MVLQVDLGQGAADRLGQVPSREPHRPAEVNDVLPDREVRVHTGRLRHVADLVAQGQGAGLMAEDSHGAGLDDLDADDGPHQCRLAGARGPEQADDLASGDLEGQGR